MFTKVRTLNRCQRQYDTVSGEHKMVWFHHDSRLGNTHVMPSVTQALQHGLMDFYLSFPVSSPTVAKAVLCLMFLDLEVHELSDTTVTCLQCRSASIELTDEVYLTVSIRGAVSEQNTHSLGGNDTRAQGRESIFFSCLSHPSCLAGGV